MNNTSQIIVWDNPIDASIYIYSIHDSKLKIKIDCNCVGLGIKTLTVSPDRKFITAGLFDTSIQIYDTTKYNHIAKFEHPTKIDLNNLDSKSLYVYQEEIQKF